MNSFKPTEYTLECVATGRRLDDTGWLLEDRMCATPSLVRTIYTARQIDVKGDDDGLYKFHDWLPIRRMLSGSAAPVTYRSTGLAAALGLDNLWITFSGWNPVRGARMTTCSFKETEAYSVCGRIPEGEERILVVSSAGNTARAFARVCSENNIPLLLVVPADNLDALWFAEPLNDCVRLIATERGSDYFDAIHLGSMALRSKRFFAEGGAKNVARRDGMGTTMLSAATTIGEIPDYYFQAVGSGTGAIAAWEANMRLLQDGRFGNKKCRLIVSQNAPFVPIYDAWRVGSLVMLDYDEGRARRDTEIIDAKVLSNRRPPYGIAGGLYDALKDTDGDVMVATNAQGRKAAELFARTEGCDIHPAAAVATATLVKAAAEGRIEKGKIVMLNITGGGENLFKTAHTAAGKEIWHLKPSHIFSLEATADEVVEVIEELFPTPQASKEITQEV